MRPFMLAVASTLALMLLLGAVSDALASHALAGEAQIAWQAQLDRMDEALGRNAQDDAALFWREAYAAALRTRHWQGMVAVGDAYRRLGARGGFARVSDAKAREAYRAALFRAREEGSLEGVLRVAEAFAELGDRAIVERCISVARTIASQARDGRADERVRGFAERWEARRLEVEKRNGAGRQGTIQ